MNQSITDIGQFIIWFAELKAVPLQTRRDFVAHLLEVEHFDAKAQTFVTQTLEQLAEREDQQIAGLKQQLEQLNNSLSLEKNPETSLAGRITRQAVSWMQGSIEDFKGYARGIQATKAQTAESAEHETELNQVAALKASL